MFIKELELDNFRNYEHLKVSFSQEVNIFLGENAQGKTNLLEGIYLHAMARSFKTQRDRELIRFEEEYCKTGQSLFTMMRNIPARSSSAAAARKQSGWTVLKSLVLQNFWNGFISLFFLRKT